MQDTDPAHAHVSLSHVEFLELISLVHHETLDKFDARLAPLLRMRPAWYTGLARVLQNKYMQHCRQFSSEDGQVSSSSMTFQVLINVQVHHTVVLHETNLSMFALLSVDSEEGTLAIVHREPVPGGGYRSVDTRVKDW